MYNNWHNQQTTSKSSRNDGTTPSWVQQAGYQTNRAGFGFKPQSGAAVLASLDDKVSDADAKLRDFMAEIESMDDTPEQEDNVTHGDGLTRTSVPGFVSGGHVISEASGKDVTEVEEEGEPLVEPTTTWQHLMDENTKHYYYWNTVTNSVTWTIPQDYTEYLVRHKLYREALEAGKKTMPSISNSAELLSLKSATKLQNSKSAETEEETTSTEIGPQMPDSLKSKILSSDKEGTLSFNQDLPVNPETTETLSQSTPIGGILGYGSETTEILPQSKPIGDILGYGSETTETLPQSRPIGDVLGYESEPTETLSESKPIVGVLSYGSQTTETLSGSKHIADTDDYGLETTETISKSTLITGVVGYDSEDDDSESESGLDKYKFDEPASPSPSDDKRASPSTSDEKQATPEREPLRSNDIKPPAKQVSALKSLVAYDDSYNINDDDESEEEGGTVDSRTPTPPVIVEGPQLPPQPTARPLDPEPVSELTEYAYDMTGYGDEDQAMDAYYEQEMYNAGLQAPHNGHTDGEFLGYSRDYTERAVEFGPGEQLEGDYTERGLEFGPGEQPEVQLFHGPVNQDVPLAFNHHSETRLIFTGAPPPPPPPEEPSDDDKADDGLSSVEISAYSSVIMDKLHFLDVNISSLSKLQMLLIQLKTRLDDWQDGGLSKEYLIKKLQETDELLEVCEADSAPAGWCCNWSRKEKQYYYIHEITDELSWTFPEEDVEAVRQLAASKQNNKTKQKEGGRLGTLSHLTQAIEVRTVDADLKALFLEKIVEKCTDILDNKLSELSTNDSSKTKEETGAKLTKSKSRSRSRSKEKEKTVRVSKRHHSDSDGSLVDESKKSKKSKHKRKEEKAEKKHKKHSKHKKSKSSTEKKAKHKKRRSKSSSSVESAEDVKHKQVGKDQRQSPERNAGDTRAHSPTAGETRLSERKTAFKYEKSAADDYELSNTKQKHTFPEGRAAAKDMASLKNGDSSAEEMDISPLPSGVTTPEPQLGPSNKDANSSPSTFVTKNAHSEDISIDTIDDLLESTEKEMKSKIVRTDDIDELLESIEKEVKPKPASTEDIDCLLESVEKQVKPEKVTSESLDIFLESIEKETNAKIARDRMVVKAPPPPPPLEKEETSSLPPPKSAEQPAQYSTTAAPVFYQPPVIQKEAVTLTSTPILYHEGLDKPAAAVASALPIKSSPEKSASPIRLPDRSQLNDTATLVNESKPLKDHKTKTKKSSKKSSKMPAALVQKWQKVQSEITTDIMKEKKLKDELLK